MKRSHVMGNIPTAAKEMDSSSLRDVYYTAQTIKFWDTYFVNAWPNQA